MTCTWANVDPNLSSHTVSLGKNELTELHYHDNTWASWHFKILAPLLFNSLRLRQNGRHFADDIFNCIFSNENVWIPIKISLKFVPKDPINNIPALVQIMAWRRPGVKPLSEPLMVNLLMHICVTWPQWVNSLLKLKSKKQKSPLLPGQDDSSYKGLVMQKA